MQAISKAPPPLLFCSYTSNSQFVGGRERCNLNAKESCAVPLIAHPKPTEHSQVLSFGSLPSALQRYLDGSFQGLLDIEPFPHNSLVQFPFKSQEIHIGLGFWYQFTNLRNRKISWGYRAGHLYSQTHHTLRKTYSLDSPFEVEFCQPSSFSLHCFKTNTVIRLGWN